MIKFYSRMCVVSDRVVDLVLQRHINQSHIQFALNTKRLFSNPREINKNVTKFNGDHSNWNSAYFKSSEVESEEIQSHRAIQTNNVLKVIKSNNNYTELYGTERNIFKLPGIYASLSKWYLSLFVVMTADAGYCLAPTQFDHFTFFLATVGIALCSCSANTLNQLGEVPYDAQMDRTRNRPLVRGGISSLHALGFSFVTGFSGVGCLYFGVNMLTASLGLANIVLYASVYTPLKRIHWINTWVGAVVGAIPPIMGWTAATGNLDSGAFIFAGILYAWQFPHFYALAWRRRGDYARGSYHMLPLSNPSATRCVVLAHSVYLCGLCLAAPLTGITSMSFVYMSIPANIWMMYSTYMFYKQRNSRTSQVLYKTSLYYLLLISIALIVDRKVLVEDIKSKDYLKFVVPNV